MKSKKEELYSGVGKIISKKKNGRMVKRDWQILSVLLVVVILLSIVNFASTETPQTGITTTANNQYVIVEVDNGSPVGEIFYYAGISERDSNNIVISTSNSLAESTWISKKVATYENALMYSWEVMHNFEGKNTNKYVIFKMTNEGNTLNEIVLTSALTGEALDVTVVESTITNAENLFDENKYFDGTTTNVNSMYFDEIYFARTAYEILHDMPIYETSHPQLGKIIISLGVSIFGMNPLGYRIMGLIFSIFSVFVMYLFGKKVFKSTMLASVMALFFACDGLRFVQGRIGTVDSFLVLFIILAYFFMYSFFEKGMDINSIKRSLLPFCVSGIFFGLAISVKWNGVYAGLGLGVIFLLVLARTISERKAFMEKCTVEADRKIYQKRFIDAINMMFISGVAFFVIIPLGIYFVVFAYVDGNGTNLFAQFIQKQKDMLGYHSDVTSVHKAASPFWSWPFNAKGVWLYGGDSNYAPGMYSRIQSMTVTALAVYGILAIVYFVRKALYYNKKKKANELTADEIEYFNHIKVPAIFFTIGLCANWLPWMLISRSTFLYHFYPAMPFYIGLIVTYFYSKTLLQRNVHYSGEMVILNGKKGSITVGQNALFYACIIVVINFVMFYPVFSGIPIAKMPALFMFGWANGFWQFGLFPY